METIDKVSVAYKLVEECQLRQFIDIIECGLEANTIIRDKGISLLHLAVGIEPPELSNEFTQILLQNGADPNIRSEDFMTPLHVAAAWGRLNAVKLLISYGGDTTLIDYERKMPIDYAYEEEHWDIVDYLFEVTEDDDEDVNDESPTFQLELDKVLLKNGDIVAEYNGEDELIKKSHFELTEKPQFDWCGNNSNLFILRNNINFFGEIKNTGYTTKDIIFTKEFQNRKCDDFNVTTRHKAILDDESLSSLKKRILDKLKKNPSSNISDDSFLNNTTNSNTNSSNSEIWSTNISKESSAGISSIAFTPTDENVKYSCYYREASDDSPPHSKSREIEKVTSNLKKADESSAEYDSEIRPKNKLYPDLSSLIHQEPLLHKTYEVLIPDHSNPEITEDESDILNACLIGDSQSSSSFKTARSNGCSYIDVTIDKFDCSKLVVEETRTSVEEEYRFTDEDEGVVLIERRLLVTPILLSSDNSLSSEVTSLSKSSSIASSVPQIMNYDNHTLRRELTNYGIDVGPITDTTKRLYLKKLYKLKKSPEELPDKHTVSKRKCYSVELEKTFRHPNWCNDLSLHSELEFKVSLQFSQPDGKRKWREGNVKSSFTYLLLDPRVTNNLPCRAASMTKADLWRTFVDSVFYIGKGKRSRPYNHLYQAVEFWNKDCRSKSDSKVNCILDIWSSGLGVVCLHVFQNVIPVEAYTREAAMIDVLGLSNLKNSQSGSYYGISASWPMKDRRKLGLYLLYRAMLIFMNEGERQLKPADIGK